MRLALSKQLSPLWLLLVATIFGLSGCPEVQPLSECDDVSCSFRGECVVMDGVAGCACEEGYHSSALACLIDGRGGVCESIDCGHGRCVDLDGEASCRCDVGYIAQGSSCKEVTDGATDAPADASIDMSTDTPDAPLDPCGGVECGEHGLCRVNGTMPQCECDPGYVEQELLCISTDNPNLEPVVIPEYESGSASHCLIPDDYPWADETLNNARCQHFFVRPGDYRSLGRVVITASGTADDRRTISLFNGNDLHPGQLSDDARANVALQLAGASYWTIDRLATMNTAYSEFSEGAGGFSIERFSTHNVFNRIYATGNVLFMQIKHGAHSNTVQNSFMDGAHRNLRSGNAHIMLVDWISGEAMQIFSTKIINNEFRNYMAVRLHDNPDTTNDPQFNGTLIDGNVIWFDGEVRIDADQTPNPEGYWSRVEATGIAIAEGSLDLTNPVVVSNNVYWGGRRRLAASIEDTSGSPPGFAVAFLGSSDVHFLDNLVIGTAFGIKLSDKRDEHRGTWRTLITGNILYECGVVGSDQPDRSGALHFIHAEMMNVHHNLVRQPRGAWAQLRANYMGNFLGENDVVGVDLPLIAERNNGEIDGIDPDTNHYHSLEEGDAIYTEDYTVRYLKFTNTPATRVIPNVLRPSE